ncbi:TPA: hypothetical protein N6470_004730, partial [Escherichia coli]|nr:hypothetical protein [Escherichia coli]
MPENDRHPGGCLCHDGIKFLKFFTFSQNPGGAYNFAALMFFRRDIKNSLQFIFVSLPAVSGLCGIFYPVTGQPGHCHNGIKFLKFFTFPAIACSRNNDAALLFFCQKKQLHNVNLCLFPQLRNSAGFFYALPLPPDNHHLP